MFQTRCLNIGNKDKDPDPILVFKEGNVNIEKGGIQARLQLLCTQLKKCKEKIFKAESLRAYYFKTSILYFSSM